MRKIIGGLVLGLLLASCSLIDGSEDPLDRDLTTVKPAWTLDAPIIGQPEVAGNIAVVIVKARKKQLDIIGVNTKTGKKAWSHPYSPGATASGFNLIPQVVKDEFGDELVAFLTPPDDLSLDNPGYWLTPLTLVDPATGKIESQSEEMFVSGPVGQCDDGVDACVRAFTLSDRKTRNLRYLSVSGVLETDKSAPKTKARLIGDSGLYSTDDRPGEKIGVRRDGKDLWEVPLEKFVGKGHTTDNGWNLTHEEKKDRYTGYFGLTLDTEEEEKSRAGQPYTYPLDKQSLVSFDGKTGKVLWRSESASRCLGGTSDGEFAKDERPVRCKIKGSLRWVDRKATASDDLAVTLEGFEPGTGKTVWSQKLPAASARKLMTSQSGFVSSDRSFSIVPLKDGPSLIATADGSTKKIEKGETFACSGQSEKFDYLLPVTSRGEKVYKRFGSGLNFLCDARGKEVKGSMTVAALREGGEKVSKTSYVMGTKEGLVGYTIAKR